MEILKPGGDLRAFFLKLAVSSQRALLLDYDGTLAPFRIDRDKAIPYPGVLDVLRGIQKVGRTRLVVVSGRWTKDLIPLLGLEELPEIWGCHGVERLLPDKTYHIAEMEERAVKGLVRAEEWAESKGWQDRCERKPASLAFHLRGLDAGEAARLRIKVMEKWQRLARDTGLAVYEFDGGVELRGTGNKGTAVGTLLSDLDEDAAVAYLGDDQTDEDAFKALGNRGLSVLVRSEFRPTAAHCWLQPPEELLEFLHSWEKSCREYS
jgi:trehalose 6-phosphate phosphatase